MSTDGNRPKVRVQEWTICTAANGLPLFSPAEMRNGDRDFIESLIRYFASYPIDSLVTATDKESEGTMLSIIAAV